MFKLLRSLHTSNRLLHPVKPVEELVKFHAKYIKPTPDELKPLKEAPKLYARIHIHNWSMLVTPGDVIKLPVNMKDVKLGSRIKFNEVSEIGSKFFTLSGGDEKSGRIDPSVFDIDGVCIEKTRVRREVDQTTRRRRRHVRNVVSNNCLTVFRVGDIKVTPASENQ